MKFLSDNVDNYGHTIIMDEFEKGSVYDPALTAETVWTTNLWMAMVQSLYDAVALCDEAGGGGAGIVADPVTMAQEASSQRPMDQAAAFWYGNINNSPSAGEGSLHA